jgi:hypothetical protein
MNQRQTKDRLSDEQCAKLDAVDFAGLNELFVDQWDEMFKCLQVYAKANGGDCNIQGQDANQALSRWVREQRKRKPLLSMEQHSTFDELSLTWEEADKEKADRKWNAMYQRPVDYKRKHGDCRVPEHWEER